MSLSCNPELISDKASEKMSLNLWNCSHSSVRLSGGKVPSEISTLEDDREIGKGSTLEVFSKQNCSKQKSRIHALWKRKSVRNVAGV